MINIILFVITLIISFGFGLNYIFRKKWMYYHRRAYKSSWNQLDKSKRILLKVFLILVGAGWLCTSISSIIIYLLSSNLIYSLAPLFILNLFTTYGSYKVKTKTQGNPPVWLSIVTLILIILTVVL